MSLIVDASVATKWFLREADFRAAQAVLRSGELLIAPDLVLAEVGNAFWKRCRKGEMSVATASEFMGELPHAFAELIPLVSLAETAMRLSAELPHPIYDCFYLALAERERMPIVSADARMIAVANRLGMIEVRRL